MLKYTKIDSVVTYFLENWDPIKEQWVTCFKDTAFNLGETTNNRLESMNSKIKRVCSKYGSLLQFFTEFFAVLGALRNERKHHRLMACARRPTSLISVEDDLQQYGKYITTYAFKHIQDQAGFSDKVRIEERISDNTFLVTKRDQTNVITSPISCQCNYLQRIGLPCRHIFKVRKLLGMSRFDESLIVDRWNNSYANNGLTTELDTAIESDQPEDCFINIQDELPQR